MRTYDPATAAYLNDLGAVVPRRLVWVKARNRSTGAIEDVGFWNGLDAQVFTVDGQAITFQGAGALLGSDPIKAGVGLNVRTLNLSLSEITPEVAQVLRGYDPRLAPVRIYRALFDPETNDLVAVPHRVSKSTADAVSIPDPAEGQTAPATMTVVSAARALTRRLSLRKSDAAQRAINPTDRGREYASVSGAVKVNWGQYAAPSALPSGGGQPSSSGLAGRSNVTRVGGR